MQDIMYSVTLRLFGPYHPIDVIAVGGLISARPGAYGLITREMSGHELERKRANRNLQLFRATTRHGSRVVLDARSITEHFPYTLNPGNIARGIGYAARIAAQIKKIEGYDIKFDPNLIRVGLGKFESNEDFEGQAGKAALLLQQRFYGGGNAAYMGPSLDYYLILGDTSRLLKGQVAGRFNTQRRFKAADSLEEILEKSGIRV